MTGYTSTNPFMILYAVIINLNLITGWQAASKVCIQTYKVHNYILHHLHQYLVVHGDNDMKMQKLSTDSVYGQQEKHGIKRDTCMTFTNQQKFKTHTRIILRFLLIGLLRFSSMKHNQIFWICNTIHKFLPKPSCNIYHISFYCAYTVQTTCSLF